MVKRYYYGLISLRYVYFMFGLPMVIFVLAFMQAKKRNPMLYVLMIICAVLLGVVLIFYYKNKYRIWKTLKKVENIEEYAEGGMVDRSYVLEDRMLACEGLNVQERRTDDIQSLEYEEGKHGSVLLHIESEEGSYDMSAVSKGEAQRFAAFLKRKNPGIRLIHIEPAGNGTLKELGAGVQI